MLEAAVQAQEAHLLREAHGRGPGRREAIDRGAAKKQDPKKDLAVGFQQRYGPVYLEAYKRMQEGQIGEIVECARLLDRNDPFKRVPYPDPKIEKLRNWFCYEDYSGDFIVEQDCHNFDVLHWFLDARPIRAMGMGGTEGPHRHGDRGPPEPGLRVPQGPARELRGQPDTPQGFNHVGEEFTGTKGVIETSRARMMHHQGSARGRRPSLARATSRWTESRRSWDGSRPARWRTWRSDRRSARCSRSWAGRRCTGRAKRYGQGVRRGLVDLFRRSRGIDPGGTARGQPCGSQSGSGQDRGDDARLDGSVRGTPNNNDAASRVAISDPAAPSTIPAAIQRAA